MMQLIKTSLLAGRAMNRSGRLSSVIFMTRQTVTQAVGSKVSISSISADKIAIVMACLLSGVAYYKSNPPVFPTLVEPHSQFREITADNMTLCSGDGRNSTIKILGDDLPNGAFAKAVPEDKVYQEVFNSRIVEYLYKEVFGSEAGAPHTEIGVRHDGVMNIVANVVLNFLLEMGFLPEYTGHKFKTLCSISPAIKDAYSMRDVLTKLSVPEDLQGKQVPGFGLALAISNLLSSDPNLGNIIINYCENFNVGAYPIDFELRQHKNNLTLFKPEDATSSERTLGLLKAGWIVEIEDQFNTSFDEELHQDDALVYTPGQIAILIELMRHDMESGNIEKGYRAFANLNEDKIRELVADIDLPEEFLLEQIDHIMPIIAAVKSHIDTNFPKPAGNVEVSNFKR